MGHIIRILQDGLSFKNSKIQPALQKTGENAVGSDFIKPANFNRFFQKPRILNGFFHKPRICSDLFFFEPAIVFLLRVNPQVLSLGFVVCRLLRQSVPSSSPLLPQMALLFPPTALSPKPPFPSARRSARLPAVARASTIVAASVSFFSSSCAFFINVLAGGDVGRHRWKEG
jgi:hypothetical protein